MRDPVAENLTLRRAFDVVMGFLMAIVLASGGWMMGQQVEALERLTRLETIHPNMVHAHPEVPPGWFKDQVNRIEAKVNLIDERLRGLELKVGSN